MSSPHTRTALIFGSQLFAPEHLKKNNINHVILIEHRELCTYYKFHQHKIVFFLAAMRHYSLELKQAGLSVTYLNLNQTKDFVDYISTLDSIYQKQKFSELVCYEVEDKFMESKLHKWSESCTIKLTILDNPNFLTSRLQGQQYLQSVKKPFMKTFYEGQRRRLSLLVNADGSPVGDQWSFDADNRMALPKDHSPVTQFKFKIDAIDQEVINLVNDQFSDHPGKSADFWLPTQRSQAQAWLKHFINTKLNHFGPYEDALSDSDPFIYHSLLTPFLNTGLLNPQDILNQLPSRPDKNLAIESLEGFIRQIIGWREFIRIIYQRYSTQQEASNYFNHQRLMNSNWYSGNTGCPPLDGVIKKTLKYGYAHHIERLMILSNMMNLCEINPTHVHRWFMELFIDSSDWVMGPNVYGMGLMSDGGIFATKPYICGSNYWIKMGRYKKADWCLEVDGLYWRFVREKSPVLKKNPRLSMMVKSYEKMDSFKKDTLEKAATTFIHRNTCGE